MGYFLSKGLGVSERAARTNSIEVRECKYHRATWGRVYTAAQPLLDRREQHVYDREGCSILSLASFADVLVCLSGRCACVDT